MCIVGWNNPLVNCQDLRSCNGSQLQGMLRNCAERRTMSEWHQEMVTKPKLSLLNTIFDLGLTQRCWRVQDRVICSMLMKLRGGTAHFQVETGGWQGVAQQHQVCQECDDGVIEDVDQSLDVELPVLSNVRHPIMARARELNNEFDDLSMDVKVAVILDLACRDHKIAKLLHAYVIMCGVPDSPS